MPRMKRDVVTDTELPLGWKDEAFLTIRRRTAWHGTTSSKYRRDSALFATLRGAEVAAEMWRGRGSWFVIEEQPAIALLTRQGAVVCADINAQTPFGHWDTFVGQRRIVPGVMLDDAISALGVNGTWLREIGADTIIQVVDDLEGHLGKEILTGGTTFVEHESNVDGEGRQWSDDSLSWIERPHKIDASGVLAITGAVRDLAGVASFEVALNKYVEERDAYTAAVAALEDAGYWRQEAGRSRTEATRLRSEALAAANSRAVEATEDLEWEAGYYEEMAESEEQQLADAEATAAAALATLEAVRPWAAPFIRSGRCASRRFPVDGCIAERSRPVRGIRAMSAGGHGCTRSSSRRSRPGRAAASRSC